MWLSISYSYLEVSPSITQKLNLKYYEPMNAWVHQVLALWDFIANLQNLSTDSAHGSTLIDLDFMLI